MSSDRVNRRDLIVETAAELFKKHGYNATSVRQIAEAVGVTEAALYYHFKAGKRELFEAVLKDERPDFIQTIDRCHDCESLTELVRCMSSSIEEIGRPGMAKFRWIMSEFPNLNAEEKQAIHNQHLEFQQMFADQVKQFVDDEQFADELARVLLCTYFGYGQLFWNLQLEKSVDFPVPTLVDTVLKILTTKIE